MVRRKGRLDQVVSASREVKELIILEEKANKLLQAGAVARSMVGLANVCAWHRRNLEQRHHPAEPL